MQDAAVYKCEFFPDLAVTLFVDRWLANSIAICIDVGDEVARISYGVRLSETWSAIVPVAIAASEDAPFQKRMFAFSSASISRLRFISGTFSWARVEQ